jgi:hypothetical protein
MGISQTKKQGNLSEKITKAKVAVGVVQLVQHLSSKLKTLFASPSTTKKLGDETGKTII